MIVRIKHPDGPEFEVEEHTLVKHEGVIDNDIERTTFVEYRLPGNDTVVHRSVHVTLKQWPAGLGDVNLTGTKE